LEGWGCYKLLSEPGYNIDPGWAMLVEVEEKVSERIVVEVDTNFSSEPRFSMLSLDGTEKGPLDLRFQVEIVSGGTNFEP
jgi:hypothetical protein